MAAGPTGAVAAIRTAFRPDMAGTGAAAPGAARGRPGPEATAGRLAG